MTAKEHDMKLYWQAVNGGNDYTLLDRLENLCLTKEVKESIHLIKMKRYHHEEAQAGLI